VKSVYLLSGLGADSRVFDFLSFDYCHVRNLVWIAPEQHETIRSYAARLLQQITVKRPILVGVSFGGIIAIEIAKLVDIEKVVLISSVKTRFDIPRHFRLAGWMRLHRFVPAALFKMVNPVTYWFFGTTGASERELLKEIIKDTDIQFVEWAIASILTWTNEDMLDNLTHVHGTRDRIFPLRTAHFKVADGGHLMIVDKAHEVTRILRKTITGE
jgi:pimeloyl-ACP methyl ester carboxylesterase